MERTCFERPYRGYQISGTAEAEGSWSNSWLAVARVALHRENGTVIEVDRFQNRLFATKDEWIAAWFGLGLAEIAVDHFVPSPEYYLTPMNPGWAIDILRRGAEEFLQRNVQTPKLFEALTYLEEHLDKAWLVRRYRHALRGDCRDWRDRKEKRERLRVAARGIQQACGEHIIKEINSLAAKNYRANKRKIDSLRKMLAIVLKPVRP